MGEEASVNGPATRQSSQMLLQSDAALMVLLQVTAVRLLTRQWHKDSLQVRAAKRFPYLPSKLFLLRLNHDTVICAATKH